MRFLNVDKCYLKFTKMIPKVNMTKFSALCGLVKNVKRAGWLRYLPSEHVESVADHSAKITFLTFALRGV